MATVMGGVGYGLYFMAKVCIPIIDGEMEQRNANFGRSAMCTLSSPHQRHRN